MVYRVYVERKEGLEHEANKLYSEFKDLLMIKGLKKVRVLNRYDVENIDAKLFERCKNTVFSEPQTDICSDELDADKADTVFAVEYLPGQFDQRADSAAQCVQLISQQDRPLVRSAKVYVLTGRLTKKDLEEIKKYVINPVECREASLEAYDTLDTDYEKPEKTPVMDGFIKLNKKGLKAFIDKYGLAMDTDDIEFCQKYFVKEKRDPTLTEIRVIDTYWSDHCRHTTFLTTVDKVTFEDPEIQKTYEDYLACRESLGRTKPVNLMDIATLAVRYLRKNGYLDKLDASEEINACTVKINVDVDGEIQPWLLLFKNETHNHPTEIEPFGGAATCIGGAIRDPLSGRAYVYGAMRVTGASDPLVPITETIPGKLPQRKLVTTAAAGYSSYGNQIGLATGQVDEIYHKGYMAKRMEIGAVIGAVPEKNVRREVPAPGDIIILLGGRTGRDGMGGATGSSKSHNVQSIETCGAEVQKGNAPEERKLQRMFRRYEVSRMIKRCNDFGAGGVSVAVGELAAGLKITLDNVPKKYEGLNSTELAISESQERMAVVIEKKNLKKFLAIAKEENIEATQIAEVTEDPRLLMTFEGDTVVDLSREFLDSNGAEKHIEIHVPACGIYENDLKGSETDKVLSLAGDLNVCSKRGLSEMFDSTIGAGTVMMPFGGRYQLTPSQAMVHKVSVEKGETDTVSFMAYGYNPYLTEASPYHGAYNAVVESVSKLIASGASFNDVYLTFQEYFEKPLKDSLRWGKPMAALLGAFKAQMDLKIGAIGGKDSMSGSFEKMDVPPTLVSFAVTTGRTSDVITPEFKKAGHTLRLFRPVYNKNRLPEAESLIMLFGRISELMKSGKIYAAYTPTFGGIAEAVMKMSFGNMIGFTFDPDFSSDDIFDVRYGSFLLECDESVKDGRLVGRTVEEKALTFNDGKISLEELFNVYEGKLEPVYHAYTDRSTEKAEKICYKAKKVVVSSQKCASPKVLIPVFPGTNCEYDSAKAWMRAGAEPDVFVIKNLDPESVKESAEEFSKRMKKSQVVFIPGGFSGGDEPDGSGKFITAFFRNALISASVKDLMNNRDGLMLGICNGFQALVKLGLVPYGEIRDMDSACPTLTFNNIARHQSRIVSTKIVSNKSPWFMCADTDTIYNVPISHGEGRFYAPAKVVDNLIKYGQVATQYVDLDGQPTYDILYNPNGSVCAIEGITSPDGRILGKMGHTERTGDGLYKNVPGEYDMKLFESAVKYFK